MCGFDVVDDVGCDVGGKCCFDVCGIVVVGE